MLLNDDFIQNGEDNTDKFADSLSAFSDLDHERSESVEYHIDAVEVIDIVDLLDHDLEQFSKSVDELNASIVQDLYGIIQGSDLVGF